MRMVRVGLDKLERDRKATVKALKAVNTGRRMVAKQFNINADQIF